MFKGQRKIGMGARTKLKDWKASIVKGNTHTSGLVSGLVTRPAEMFWGILLQTLLNFLGQKLTPYQFWGL